MKLIQSKQVSHSIFKLTARTLVLSHDDPLEGCGSTRYYLILLYERHLTVNLTKDHQISLENQSSAAQLKCFLISSTADYKTCELFLRSVMIRDCILMTSYLERNADEHTE